MDCHNHVNWLKVCVQWDDLNQSLLILLANTLNDKRAVPNQQITSACASNGHFFVRDEDSLSEVGLTLIFTTEIFLLNSWRIVLESWNAGFPRQEEDSLLAV